MELCSEGHDEICYDEKSCPACDLKNDRDYFEAEVSKLEQKITELEDKIVKLNNILDSIDNQAHT
jgi:uncharacterized protein YceH (UPF0502 family)